MKVNGFLGARIPKLVRVVNSTENFVGHYDSVDPCSHPEGYVNVDSYGERYDTMNHSLMLSRQTVLILYSAGYAGNCMMSTSLKRV